MAERKNTVRSKSRLNRAQHFKSKKRVIESNMTKRKILEKALAESEEWHRALVETVGKAGNGIIILQNTPEREAAIVFVNDEASKIMGYSRDEALSLSAWDFFEPAELAVIQGRYRQRQRGEQVPSYYETNALHKNGKYIPLEISLSVMNYQDKVATVVFFKDITERKRMEKELNEHHQNLEKLVEERTAELKRINRQLQREIAERKQTEELLQIGQNYYQYLLENALDGIAIVNRDGTMRYQRPAIESILGYTLEERNGMSTLELVHSDDLPKATEAFAELMQNPGKICHIEVRGRHKDGSCRTLEIIGKSLIGDPIIDGIVANYRDITERKQAEEKLQELYRHERDLRQQLEAEMKRRVEFTRTLAHELKTPLTPMLISSQVLASELKDEPMSSLARNIGRGASNLNSRIDELLDLAKGEVGVLQLKTEPSEILQLLREVAEYVSPVASNRKQSLVLELPDTLPLVKADKGRVRQVLLNLLNNAFKFTPEGGRVILRAGKEKANLIVEIEDNGPGIDVSEQRRIFEPYQPMGGDGEQLSGLGLGLALCKMLVELHGGRIWVKSQSGKGSIFSFSLPLEVARQ